MPYFFYDHPIRILYACPYCSTPSLSRPTAAWNNLRFRKNTKNLRNVVYVTLKVDNF